MDHDDLVGWRIQRITCWSRAGESLNELVWRSLARHDNVRFNIAGLAQNTDVRGIVWRLNPHELFRVARSYDPQTGRMTGHENLSIWLYALISRRAAIVKTLLENRRVKSPRLNELLEPQIIPTPVSRGK